VIQTRVANAAAALLLCMILPAAGQEAAPSPTEVPPAAARTLDTVVVAGVVPGPGLWRLRKDDHTMWILGTLQPLPKKMHWVGREVEQRIGAAQEVLLPASAEMRIGGLTALSLLPSLPGLRNNPDGATLAEVLPPELLVRWRVAAQRYLGDDHAHEKRRPLFAAEDLYTAALDRTGLVRDATVTERVLKMAKNAKVSVTHPAIQLTLQKPRQAVKDFKRARLDDLTCMRQTLDRIETDLAVMRERADAWAYGDLEALFALPYVEQQSACDDAILAAQWAETNGIEHLRPRLRELWLDAARAALDKNTETFAVLPITEIRRSDGMVAALQAEGCVLEPPGAASDDLQSPEAAPP
jgi:hypothetical protein